MNFPFLDIFRPKPIPQAPRYYAATKAENSLARQKRLDRQLELAVACSQLTPAQRAAFKSIATNPRDELRGRG